MSTVITPALASNSPVHSVRELLRALGALSDFRRFSELLAASIGKLPGLGNMIMLSETAEAEDAFMAGRLTVPIQGKDGGYGALQLALGEKAERGMGPEDLHLMGGLAALMARLLDHAAEHAANTQLLALCRVLAELVPVGIVAVDADGAVRLANERARSWLGAPLVEGLGFEPESLHVAKLGYDWRSVRELHLPLQGKLCFVQVSPSAPAETGGQVLILNDLSHDQSRLLDGLQRELFRGRWLQRPVAFALLSTERVYQGLLAELPRLRGMLRAGELAGPYDARRIGFVLPDADESAGVRRLRELQVGLAIDGLDAAVVEADAGDAEEVLNAALSRLAPLPKLVRPTLLLHDDYPVVNDMIAMALGPMYDVVKSSNLSETRELLKQRRFDALITELELRGGESGADLLREARVTQPSIRSLFTTVQHEDRFAEVAAEFSGSTIIRKPFDVKGLGQMIQAALK